MTVTFQQGIAGYAGARGLGISTYGGLGSVGQYNANGMTFGDGQADWCMGMAIPSSPAYDEILLLRFDVSSIPPTATVVSATLSLLAYHYDTVAVAIEGRYLAQPPDWTTTCAGCTAPTGWRYRLGPSVPWAGLGASGSGDTLAGLTFRLPDTGPMPAGTRSVITGTLSPAVVQSWLTGPNHGLRLVPTVSAVHLGVIQPQHATAGAMSTPKLTVTYLP